MSDQWLERVKDDDDAATLARRGLARRLYDVARLLPVVARSALDNNLEPPTDELSKAAERSLVALSVFAPVLPPGRLRWICSQLRRISESTDAINTVALVRCLAHYGLGSDAFRTRIEVDRVNAGRALWRLWLALDEGDRLVHELRLILRAIDSVTEGAQAFSERRLAPRIERFFRRAPPRAATVENCARLRRHARDLACSLELAGGGRDLSNLRSALKLLRQLDARLREVQVLDLVCRELQEHGRAGNSEHARERLAAALSAALDWWDSGERSRLRELVVTPEWQLRGGRAAMEVAGRSGNAHTIGHA